VLQLEEFMLTGKQKVRYETSNKLVAPFHLHTFSFSGTFKPAAAVIRDELTNEQREQLVCHITEAFKDFRTEDVVALAALLMTNQSLVLKTVTQFLVNEMRMQIID
jgi:hypothetical protein